MNVTVLRYSRVPQRLEDIDGVLTGGAASQ